MGVKLGHTHWGRNIGWGCLRTACWGEYLGLRGSKLRGEWRKLHNEELNPLTPNGLYSGHAVSPLNSSRYSRVPMTFLVDWRLCVACYYPTTSTDYPNTIRGRSVGHPVAVKIDICEYIQFFEHYFRLICMGTVRHWQPFWSRKSFCFIGQCWYFNPQWTLEWAIIKAQSVRNILGQLGKLCSY